MPIQPITTTQGGPAAPASASALPDGSGVAAAAHGLPQAISRRRFVQAAAGALGLAAGAGALGPGQARAQSLAPPAGALNAPGSGIIPSDTVTAVTGIAPITSTGGTTPAIGITPATPTSDGSLIAADKAKLDLLTLPVATAITGGGALALGGFTLTVPASDTAALVNSVQTLANKTLTQAVATSNTSGTWALQVKPVGAGTSGIYVGTDNGGQDVAYTENLLTLESRAHNVAYGEIASILIRPNAAQVGVAVHNYGGNISTIGFRMFNAAGIVTMNTYAESGSISLTQTSGIHGSVDTIAAPRFTQGTGGVLTPGATYYYKVTVVDGFGGESLPLGSAEGSITLGPANTALTLTLTAVPGGAYYKIYRGTTHNGEGYIGQTNSLTFQDNGGQSVGPAPAGQNAMVWRISPNLPYSIISGLLNIARNNVATTATDGIQIANGTPATAAVPQQYSPTIHFISHAWNTATAADARVDAQVLLVPANGPVPGGRLSWQSRIGNAAFSEIAALDIAGNWSNSGALRTNLLPNGQGLTVQALTELTPIAAASSTNTTLNIPAHSLVLGVSVRVVTPIPTAATFSVGLPAAPAQYGAGLSVAAGTTFASPGTGAPSIVAGAVPVVITPDQTPATPGGQVRVTVHYLTLTPPAS